MRRAFINARVIDPASDLDARGGVLVEDGLIAGVGGDVTAEAVGDAEVVDCNGRVLAPGLIDCRVFTGEPGAEHKETLASASHAAAAGGVTTIVTMPETDPVIDDASLVDFVMRRARDTAIVRVRPMAALTKGLEGRQMTEMGLLLEAGAVGFTDGNHAVADAQVMRRAMSYARMLDAPISHHTLDPALARGGQMNEGEYSTRLGLAGIPREAETMMIERDLRLCGLTGARYHAAQISCGQALAAVEAAKARGLPVTCAVSAHHLRLNEVDIANYRTFFKVAPPLRAEEDREAMADGVARGAIDIITSSHDPQAPENKRLPFAEATFGAVGLETLLPVALGLHHEGLMSLSGVLKAMTANPAALLGLDAGRLARGAPADLVVFDPGVPWVLRAETLRSRSKNTPFDGRRFQGRADMTVVGGEIVFRNRGEA